MTEVELRSQHPHQTPLDTLHHSPLPRLRVVITPHVEKTVHQVAHQFVRPGGPVPPRLHPGNIQTDHHFAAQPTTARPGIRWRAVIEGNHVSGAVVAEVLPVQRHNLIGPDQTAAQFVTEAHTAGIPRDQARCPSPASAVTARSGWLRRRAKECRIGQSRTNDPEQQPPIDPKLGVPVAERQFTPMALSGVVRTHAQSARRADGGRRPFCPTRQ